jgi:hypothetical protein
MKPKTFKIVLPLILFLSILALLKFQDKSDDAEEGLTHRVFYGTVSEAPLNEDDKDFTIMMSELKDSHITFIFTQDTLYNDVSEFRVGDYIKVESEYYESSVGPNFKYPVLTVEVIDLTQ